MMVKTEYTFSFHVPDEYEQCEKFRTLYPDFGEEITSEWISFHREYTSIQDAVFRTIQ